MRETLKMWIEKVCTLLYMRRCQECGKWYNSDATQWNLSDERKYMVQHGACFDCSYWLVQLIKSTGDRLVIEHDGERIQYTAHPFIKGYGYGGSLWMYQKDGAVQSTRDMWHQGVIPKHLYYRFPVNARFLPAPRYNLGWHTDTNAPF